ncbi:hypothetical protein [Nitrosomonas sp. Is37]|uniref:hypothetical protein n=1 Tax=Nitrosomonas sp. Is37 TaxID=3080535 RepID=UPI003981B607
MLGIRLTLTFDGFRRIAHMPEAMSVGFIVQYSIMPLLSWGRFPVGLLFCLYHGLSIAERPLPHDFYSEVRGS